MNETVVPKNPLDEVKKENLGGPQSVYSEKDRKYLSFLQYRLENAMQQKQQPYEEFNGKSYYDIFDENEKIANTNLPKKINEDDVVVSAGTVESKLDALLSNIASLDLSSEVLAYDKENNLVSELGTALEDTIAMTEELDDDEEKKLLRQRELLKQGTVFVQEEWLRVFETKKKLTKEYNGQFKDFSEAWSEKNVLVFEGPSRTLLYGPNVFLGSMFEFDMEKQPFIFAAIYMDYKVAETMYGHFENWQFVHKGQVPENITKEQRSIFNNNWRLSTLQEEQVEVILYQDQPRDEFQILINGVLMLPAGFPLSAVSPAGKYNITKQVFRVINSKFAYGKSFVESGAVKEISALIDEMLKLFVLKTRKSYAPPYINTSGRVISRRVLSAGRITMGITPDALQPIGQEGQGVTSSEFNVLKELTDRVDKSTVSNIFQGQQGKSGTTATEIVELQRQAKLTLGLAIAAVSLLEKKLGYLRLWNILENWFERQDTRIEQIDGARREVGMYRNTVREVNIDGEGLGNRMVIPTDGMLPNSKKIRNLEIDEERKTGYPVRKIYLNPEKLKAAKLRWFISILPKEKASSALNKLMFREMFADLMAMTQLGIQPNIDSIEDEFARAHGKKRSKIFSKGAGMQPMVGPGGEPLGGGVPNSAGVPKPQLPVGADV